jgi:hypothetical protein
MTQLACTVKGYLPLIRSAVGFLLSAAPAAVEGLFVDSIATFTNTDSESIAQS